MNAIRITQKLESDTLYLPQLRSWVGRNVEIIVLENPPTQLQKQRPISIQNGSASWQDRCGNIASPSNQQCLPKNGRRFLNLKTEN